MISPSSVRPRTADALLVMALLISLIAGTVLVWRSLQEAESLRGQQLLQQETNSLARQIETHFNYQSDALQRLANAGTSIIGNLGCGSRMPTACYMTLPTCRPSSG